MSKSEAQVLDFDKICRLCLMEKGSLSAIFSKEKSDSNVPLSVRIMSCAALELYEGDGLPGSICSKCLLLVNQSFAFREQCEQADATLRKQTQKTETENEIELETETNLCEAPSPIPESILSIPQETITEPETVIAEDTTTEEVKQPVFSISKSSSACEALHILVSRSGLTVTKKTKSGSSVKLTTNKLKPTISSAVDTTVGKKPPRQFSSEQFFKEYAGNDQSQIWKDGRIYCKECKIFIGRPYFFNHVKYVHKKVRDHLCQSCGYRAHTGHMLRFHIESQHSGTVLPCPKCSLTFSSNKRFNMHMKKRHSGKPIERKHICQYCGKAFTTPNCLRSHIRVHTRETPYACQFCDRKFSFKRACKTHERLHTGVKPYKCTICGEAFTQNCVRKNHEYRAHGNEEFNPKNRKPREGPNYTHSRSKNKKQQHHIVVDPIDVVQVVTDGNLD